MCEVAVDVLSCSQTQVFIICESTVNDARDIFQCFISCTIMTCGIAHGVVCVCMYSTTSCSIVLLDRYGGM